MASSFRSLIYAVSVLSLIAGVVGSSHAYGEEKRTTLVLKKEETAKPVTFYEERDSVTQELIRLQYQPTPMSDLRRFVPPKPSQLVGVPPAGGFKGAAKQLAIDFIPEYVAFTIALGLTGTLHYENSPTYLKSFADQNLSWLGAGSFAGFLVGSRSSHAMLQWSGLAYDARRADREVSLRTPRTLGPQIEVPVRDYKGNVVTSNLIRLPGQPEYFKTQVIETPVAPTAIQRKFAPLVGPLGLAAGMIVSNTIHEIAADKNMQLCAKATYGNEVPPTDPAAAKLYAEAVDTACERAWEDWALAKKIGDYTPDMLSMAAASFIQAYAANPLIKSASGLLTRGAKAGTTIALDKSGVGLITNRTTGKLQAFAMKEGAERVIPLVLRSARVFAFFGQFAAPPVVRVGMTAGNIWLFMEISHALPSLKNPFEQARQGFHITSAINKTYRELARAEKNKWNWIPFVSAACNGGPVLFTGAPEVDMMSCSSAEQFSPAHLLKKLAQNQAKWREFVLTESYAAHTDWQSYVSGFAAMYSNARTFYSYIISLVRFKTLKPEIDTDLDTANPFHGLYTDPQHRNETAGDAVLAAREWLEAYIETPIFKQRQSSKLWGSSTDAVVLPQILTGLRAIDENVPVTSLGAPEFSLARDNGKLSPKAREELEAMVRNRSLTEAIVKLRKVLKGDPRFNDRGISPSSSEYKIDAENNPFMTLRLKLGDPEPLSAGVFLIRSLNDSEQIIAQDSKFNSPMYLAHFETRTMTEYLAASMICGPELNTPSDEAQIKIYRDRKMSFTARLLDNLGLGKRGIGINDADVLIAVKEQMEEDQASSISRLPTPKSTSVATEWKGVSADFHPPRIVTGVPDSVCRELAINKRSSGQNLSDIFSPQWTFGGRTYNGVLDIIRRHVRPELIGKILPPSDKKLAWEDPFLAWWSGKTDKHIDIMVAKFREQYREILKKKYIPALTKRGTDGSATYNDRVFKLGALESLYDEANLYLDILGILGQASKDGNFQKPFKNLAANIDLQFRNMGELVTDLELVEAKAPIAKVQYDQRRAALEASLAELKKVVEARQAAIKATKSATDSNDQAVRNMTALLGEMDSYWGIIRSIQVSPAH